jgi:predicted dehydrogenase
MNEPLKIGLVGLDSSHCVEYATLLHDATHPHHVPGARIVAAYPGGSADWPLSATRVPGFFERMTTEFGVSMVASLEEVAAVSDAIMILAVDGRVHRSQFGVIAKAGKPVYIDKPLCVTVADAEEIRNVAQTTGARVFSASVWRFSRGLGEAIAALDGPCRHAHLHGQWPLEDGLHGWFYYGIHQVEMLYAAMGPGCRRVVCNRDGASEVLTGFWDDGRVATIVTNHEEHRPFGGWLLGGTNSALLAVKDSKHERYRAFLQKALAFFRGGETPVALPETLETIAFLAAAATSAGQGGKPVAIHSFSP